jgi:hypothetical protein
MAWKWVVPKWVTILQVARVILEIVDTSRKRRIVAERGGVLCDVGKDRLHDVGWMGLFWEEHVRKRCDIF